MQPGGSLFITTINKTNLSYALGIVVAEQLLRIVPSGTHDWEKFISPVELERLLESSKSLPFYRVTTTIDLLQECFLFPVFSSPSPRWFLSAVRPRDAVQPRVRSLELDRQHCHQLRPPRRQSARRPRRKPGRGPRGGSTQLSQTTREQVRKEVEKHSDSMRGMRLRKNSQCYRAAA